METQNYANHRQVTPLFHYILMPLLALTTIGSLVNLYLSFGDHERLYSASLLAVLSLAALLALFLSRISALKAQDRAIRAEENLRHFVLTGKLPDPRLTIRQLIALRFASDGELVPLSKRAAEENLKPDDIKKSVKQWRPDTYRL
jgi:hypothetical protein